MEENREILRKYKEVLRREYMQTSYLDQFPLVGDDLPGVTVIIPTFNRSPYPVERDSNPLGWCFDSLLTQRNSGLNEIIVVDDASQDFTEAVVNHFKPIALQRGIEVVYVRNHEKKGSAITRNLGVATSKNGLVTILDDDCVFGEYAFFGAEFTLSNLPDEAAVVHFPVYDRKRNPDLVGLEDIGSVDFGGGFIKDNFHGFPREYVANLEGNFMDQKLRILQPIEIKNLSGFFMIKKKAFNEAGGFPENFTWRNSYREETELAMRLIDRGYKLFFMPDPKFSMIHLKYGYKITDSERDAIGEIINRNGVPRINTGNRVNSEEWFHSALMSTYVTFGLRNFKAAEEYAKRMYREFVENNDYSVAVTGRKIENRSERIRIYDEAIRSAKDFIRSQKVSGKNGRRKRF